jgi:hypothetical protein
MKTVRTYTYYTEDGKETVGFDELKKRPDIHAKVGLIASPPFGRMVVHAGLEIYSYPLSYLEDKHDIRRAVDEVRSVVDECPMAFFIPHSPTSVDFLNETTVSLKGLIAGNGYGKSAAMWIDILLDIVPCDRKWPIFVDGGVKYRPYKGPMESGGVGLVTYEWGNHISTIYPQIIQRWTPKWAYPDFATGKKRVAWNSRPRITVCDTEVYMLACSQPQAAFESQALNIYGWDEQGTYEKFVGANERVRRRNGRHVFALTGHQVEGRPDTGGGSFINDIDKGRSDFGHTVAFFQGALDETPDHVFSEKQKDAAYRQWVIEPSQENPPNKRRLREGRARLYGEWQESSGLVYEDFDTEFHCIDRFKIPMEWTKYRAVDHGRVNPTACLCAAVNPEGDIFLFDEYYKADETISYNVNGIVEKCGNRLVRSEVFDPQFKRFEEKWVKCRFRRTVLDSRSFAKKDENSNLTIGELYNKCGLRCLPASGQRDERAVPLVQELFRIDPERVHWQTKQKGAPRMYVFSDLHSFLLEIVQYRNAPDSKGHSRRPHEMPCAIKDHLMSCLKYLVQIPLTYVEGAGLIEEEDEDDIEERKRRTVYDRYTGY